MLAKLFWSILYQAKNFILKAKTEIRGKEEFKLIFLQEKDVEWRDGLKSIGFLVISISHVMGTLMLFKSSLTKVDTVQNNKIIG